METTQNKIDWLNNLDEETFKQALFRCCGSWHWVAMMTEARPFADENELYEKADAIWFSLSQQDWIEAFRHHPKIGDVDRLREKFAATANWASGEQSGVSQADEETLAALAEGNNMYDEKFGFIFIVCATGKTADEMLDILQDRLQNDADVELRIAAGEQAKITKIRLDKLLQEAPA